MNADTHLLLSSILEKIPCLDGTLDSAVQTTPLLLHYISLQCFYFLYLLLVVRRLLTDSHSAYSLTIDYFRQVQQQKIQRLEAAKPLMRPTLPGVAPPSLGLDVYMTVVGGGAVGRRIVRLLLRTKLFHPSRMTVITRQPDNLTTFANQGVRVMDHKHGRENLQKSDVVVLCCQPGQLADFAKEHFTQKTQGEDVFPPARLRPSAVVLSCIAAVTVAKIATLLHVEPDMILRTAVPATTELPQVAARYATMRQQSTEGQVQRMRDTDSFLREAVVEADDTAVEQVATTIVTAQRAAEEAIGAPHIPHNLVTRNAYQAALGARQQTLTPVDRVLLDRCEVPFTFVIHVWCLLQRHADICIQTGAKKSANKHRDDIEGAFVCTALAMLSDENHPQLLSFYQEGRKKTETAKASEDVAEITQMMYNKLEFMYKNIGQLTSDLKQVYSTIVSMAVVG